MLYEGWLYAAVANPDGTLAGLFMTKDSGADLDQGPDPDLSRQPGTEPSPSADPDQRPDPAQLRRHQQSARSPTATTTISLAVDPTNPNIVYLGGTSDGQTSGLIRIDTTGIYDSHALRGLRQQISTTAASSRSTPPAAIRLTKLPPACRHRSIVRARSILTGIATYLNLIQNPNAAVPARLDASSSINITSTFTNGGDPASTGPRSTSSSTPTRPTLALDQRAPDRRRYVDPLTGQDAADRRRRPGDLHRRRRQRGSGTLDHGDRHRDGAVDLLPQRQPPDRPALLRGRRSPAPRPPRSPALSSTATASASVARRSDPQVLSNGTIQAVLTDGDIQAVGTASNTLRSSDASRRRPQGTGIATDQQGQGIVYQYVWPGFSGSITNFFQVSVNGGPFIRRDQRPDPGRPMIPSGRSPFRSIPATWFRATSRSTRSTATRSSSSSNAGRIFRARQ